MNFNLFQYLYLVIVFFILRASSIEIIFFTWYSIRVVILAKLYSHIRFILLILEIISLITIGLTLVFMLKSLTEPTFFFLLLCLIVGEACLGLSLIIISSRFQKKELISLSLV